MNKGPDRREGSRRSQQKVDWQAMFAAFEQQPTWEDYFKLREKIRQVIPRKNRHQRNKLLDRLDLLAYVLCHQEARITVARQAVYLELKDKPFRDKWHNRRFRDFSLDVVKYAWGLPKPPGFKLVRELLDRQVTLSDQLREAGHLLQQGNVPSNISQIESYSLLLWVQAKYFQQSKVVKVVRALRQALGKAAPTDALWQELAHLLGPVRPDHKPKPPTASKVEPPQPKPTETKTPPQPKQTEANTPAQSKPTEATQPPPAEAQTEVTAPTQPPPAEATAPPQAEATQPPQTKVTAPTEAKQTAPLQRDLTPSKPPQADIKASKPPQADMQPPKSAPTLRQAQGTADLKRAEPPKVMTNAAQQVLFGWQQAVAEFTTIVAEQAASIAQRDEFITLLQQQQAHNQEVTQQAREEAETRVKRTLMHFLAEPLDQFQQTIALHNQDDFLLIYESFAEALAELHILPIGKIGQQFTVGPNHLVRSQDGQPVAGHKVEQTGLGWQLQLSNGEVRPLVRPFVRRLNR